MNLACLIWLHNFPTSLLAIAQCFFSPSQVYIPWSHDFPTWNCFNQPFNQPCQAATMACLGWCMVQATTWPARASARMLSMTHRASQKSRWKRQPWAQFQLDTQDGSLYHPNLKIPRKIMSKTMGITGSLLLCFWKPRCYYWQWCPLNSEVAIL